MKLSDLIAPEISDLTPDGEWTPIEMPFSATGGSSFVDGDPQGNRLRIRQFVRESDSRYFAKVWFGPDAEGPPNHAHGGSMAAILDHAMGVGAWASGHPVVAAKIIIDFRRKLPLGLVVTAEAWVDGTEGKKVHTAGRLYANNPDEPFATGEGLFVRQKMEAFTDLMGHADRLKEHMLVDPEE